MDRHAAHREQSYRRFLRRVAEAGDLLPIQAESAAYAVTCALRQRLFGDEPLHFEAQLPSHLRELVHHCPLHRGAFPRRFGYDELSRLVAEDLDPGIDVDTAIRAVLRAIRLQISSGEAHDLGAQLPPDLARLWEGAASPTPVHPHR